MFGSTNPSTNSADLASACVATDGIYICTCHPGRTLETDEASENSGINYRKTRCQVTYFCALGCDNHYGTGENFPAHNVNDVDQCCCSCSDGYTFDNDVCFNLNQAYIAEEFAPVTTAAYAV